MDDWDNTARDGNLAQFEFRELQLLSGARHDNQLLHQIWPENLIMVFQYMQPIDDPTVEFINCNNVNAKFL